MLNNWHCFQQVLALTNVILLLSDNFSHKVWKGKELSIRCQKENEKTKICLENTPEDLECFRAMKTLEVDREELINDANRGQNVRSTHRCHLGVHLVQQLQTQDPQVPFSLQCMAGIAASRPWSHTTASEIF